MIAHAQAILILAENDGVETFFQLIVFAVIIGGSLISAYLKKSNEKREQEKAEQRARELKESLARRDPGQQDEDESGWRSVTPPPTPVQTQGEKKALRDFIQPRKADSHSVFAAPPKPVEVPKKQVAAFKPIEHIEAPKVFHPEIPEQRQKEPTIEELMRKSKRQRRSGAETPRASTLSALPGETQGTVRTRVALDDPKTARAAIIFHEILSRPKALHDEQQLWD